MKPMVQLEILLSVPLQMSLTVLNSPNTSALVPDKGKPAGRYEYEYLR